MGSVYVKKRDKIINVGMIHHGSCEDTKACRVSDYGLTGIGTTFNDRVNFCERRRREPLGGSGGILHPPTPPPPPPPPPPPSRKFSNLKALKRHFQHSRADDYVEKVLKINRYFLLDFEKRALSSAVKYFQN